MTRTMRRRTVGLATAAFAALALSACGGQVQQGGDGQPVGEGCEAPASQLSIATGNSTGVYYVLGGAIADLLGSETELRATAAETGASVQNIEQLVAGDYDIAFSLADSATDAVEGTGSFDEPQPVEALGVIHTNYTQVIVRADSGIESIADMEGATVSTGSPGSGTEVIALRLLEAAGLTPDSDVTTQRLDLETSVDGLQTGTIDAIFWSGGLPTPNITELFTTDADAVQFIDITPELPALQELSPLYAEGTVPADTYDLEEDVPTIVVPNVLLVPEGFDPATACDIVDTIYSNVDTLAQVHPAAEELDPTVALETGPIPLNSGAQEALEALAEG